MITPSTEKEWAGMRFFSIYRNSLFLDMLNMIVQLL